MVANSAVPAPNQVDSAKCNMEYSAFVLLGDLGEIYEIIVGPKDWTTLGMNV